VAPYGDSSNYVSGVRLFVVRVPALVLCGANTDRSVTSGPFSGSVGVTIRVNDRLLSRLFQTVPRDGAKRAQKLRLGLLSNYERTTMLQDNFATVGWPRN